MSDLLKRFTKGERVLHWLNAAAILLLGATGVVIWRDMDDLRLFGINVVSRGHSWIGGGLLIATALGFLLLRRDRVANAARRFNIGQKLNLRAFQVLLAWMAISGTTLYFGKSLGLTKHNLHLLKELHLYSAGAVGVLVVAHLAMVLLVPKNRGILRGMLDGKVEASVARKVSPEWVQGLEQPAAASKALL